MSFVEKASSQTGIKILLRLPSRASGTPASGAPAPALSRKRAARSLTEFPLIEEANDSEDDHELVLSAVEVWGEASKRQKRGAQ